MTEKHFLLLAALILGIVTASNVQAYDGFKSLSGRTAKASTERTTSEEFREILESLPKEDFREVSDNLWLMTVKIENFHFPTIVIRSEKGEVVWNCIRLAKLPSEIPADELVSRMSKLMSANGMDGDFFFSLAEDMTIMLNGCIQLEGSLDREHYIQHLIRMGEIAVKHESLWNPEESSRDTPRHVGQWNSECETMQLNLTEVHKFQLTVGKTVTSGKYSIKDNTIKMVDDNGDNLEGELIFDNANQFRLIVEGNSTTFARL